MLETHLETLYKHHTILEPRMFKRLQFSLKLHYRTHFKKLTHLMKNQETPKLKHNITTTVYHNQRKSVFSN